jgi:hypothetical protein
VKVVILALVFSVSFLCFSWSVRALTHASILVGLLPSDIPPISEADISRKAAQRPHIPFSTVRFVLSVDPPFNMHSFPHISFSGKCTKELYANERLQQRSIWRLANSPKKREGERKEKKERKNKYK